MIQLFLTVCQCHKEQKRADTYSLYQKMLQKADDNKLKCPNGCRNCTFHKDGTYQRQLICYQESETLVHEITVRCMECKECGKTHTILPSIVLPHSSCSIPFVIELVYSYLKQHYSSVEEMCLAYDVSVTTFYRLLRRFKRDQVHMLKIIQRYLQQLGKCIASSLDVSYLVRLLRDISLTVLDELLESYYQQYHFGYLVYYGMDTT